MAQHAPRPCIHPGCGRLVGTGSYCPEHQALADQRRVEQQRRTHIQYNRTRSESDKFYGSVAWRRFRNSYMALHPECEICLELGLVVEAKVVDHLKPYKERPELGLDESNMRSLCRACDNRLRHDRTGRGGSKV